MFLRRFKKRPVSRSPVGKSRWDMKRRRSRLLRFRQLLAGKTLMFFGIIGLLGGLVYALFFTPLLIITDVEVSTDYKDINVERIRQALLEQVVQSNTLFVGLGNLEKTIYDRFPDVSSMACSRSLFRQSIVCQAIGYELVAVIKHQTKKYYINENGVVIAFDNRKLGLPIFDLILNPIFADLDPGETELLDAPLEEEGPVPEEAQENPPPASLTADILQERTDGVPESTSEEEALLGSDGDLGSENDVIPEEQRLLFIQPDEAPPLEPLIRPEDREVFQIAIGKKILDPEELQTILEAIDQLESVLDRKVIQAQYVQVAGELSMTSKPRVREKEGTEGNEEPDIQEDPEHEFTILLNLRRNIESQFIKLRKTKEVIDFTEVELIDLSIDGEKIFYR